MHAIILAGGLGTRLRSVLPDIPKPMAPIQDQPFLAYLLNYLNKQGMTHILFLVHYQQQKIQDYFQHEYLGMKIEYVIEEELLGTGGAIANALMHLKHFSQSVFVLNGDTFVKLNYRAMYKQHQHKKSLMTIALRQVEDCSRYGKIRVNDQLVCEWQEKGESNPGFINAGVYLMQANIFSFYTLPKQFSLEKDFLLPHLASLNLQAFNTEDYFIDIGIPEDYLRAMQELPLILEANIPKISVIIPVLNGEKTLEKAICSVINQSYKNIELIILDGGSKDHTIDIIKRYEKHITYWHSQSDGSPSVAINIGIQKARGEFIALLMSDDWYESETFNKIAEASLKHPDAEMLTCGGRVVRFNDKTGSYLELQRFTAASSLLLSFYNICFAASAICCRFVKKSFYQQAGLFCQDEQGRHIYSNDKEFLLRAVIYGVKDIFVDYLGYTYLSHTGSSTFSYNQQMDRRLCKEHLEMTNVFLTKAKLTSRQRFILRYWYLDQSARLVLYHLLYRDRAQALTVIKAGIKKYHVIWPLLFGYTTLKIFIKRYIFKKIVSLARLLSLLPEHKVTKND